MSRATTYADLGRELTATQNEFSEIAGPYAANRGVGAAGNPALERRFLDLVTKMNAIGARIGQLFPDHPGALPLESIGPEALRLMDSLGQLTPEQSRAVNSSGSLPHSAAAVPTTLLGQAAAAEAARAAPSGASVGAGAGALDPEIEKHKSHLQSAYNPLDYIISRFTGPGLEEAAAERAKAAREPTILPPRRPLPPPPSPEVARTGGVPGAIEASLNYGPGYLTGPEGAQRRVIEHAFTNYNDEMASIPHKYKGDRLAPLTGSHQKARDLLDSMFENRVYLDMFDKSRTHTNAASEKSHLAEVMPSLEASRSSVLPEIETHMNPYQEAVVNALERRARKQFEKHTLPKVIGNYVVRGAHGARARHIAEQEAREEFEKNLQDQMAGIYHKGYETAVGTAERHKGRHLAAAREHAGIGATDEARRLEGARTLGALSGEHQGVQRLNADVLQQLGTQQQAHKQQEYNLGYHDYLEDKAAPREAFERLYGHVHRMPVSNTSHIGTNTGAPAIPQPSPFTTLGGAGLGLLGMLNQRGAGARGGFAEGGSVSYIPEQIDLMNKMRQHASELGGSNSHPMWGYLANLGAGIASSRNPRVIGAIGESIPHAHQGFQESAQRNDSNQMRALAIRQALVESQLSQQEREEKRNMLEREFQLKRLKTNAYINHLGSSGAGSNRGLPYNARTKKDYDSYLDTLTHQSEENKERKHIYGRMNQNIKSLEDSKGLFGLGAPGGLIARTANKEGSPFQNLARMYYSDDQLASLDQLEKDRKEASTRALADLGPKVRGNVMLEKQFAAAEPSADIVSRAGLNISSGKGERSAKKQALAEATKLVFQERGNRVEAEKVAKYVVQKYGTSDDAIEHYPEIIGDILDQREPTYAPGEMIETQENTTSTPSGLRSFSKEEKIEYLKRKGKLK